MCKIRIIRRVNDTTLNSSTIDFQEININPIDRPAYVIYVNNGTYHGLDFVFLSDKEPKEKIGIANISIEYGINSGRIYNAMLGKDSINQTDIFTILTALKESAKTERFAENIKSFISAINQTIQFSKEHPVL